jgi:hypothetical protein
MRLNAGSPPLPVQKLDFWWSSDRDDLADAAPNQVRGVALAEVGV